MENGSGFQPSKELDGNQQSTGADVFGKMGTSELFDNEVDYNKMKRALDSGLQYESFSRENETELWGCE